MKPVSPMPYIICDLDGTLALIEHRLEWVARRPKQWEQFFSAVPGDTLNPAVDWLLRHITNTQVIFITGRLERYRAVTVEWLEQFGYRDRLLFMRPDSDKRDDYILKQELYERHIAPAFGPPQFILDDRDQVVAMWRKLGLACFQVRKGAY